MALEAQLPRFLWSEAINTTIILMNIGPSKANHEKIPFIIFHDKKANVLHLRIFESLAHVHIPKKERRKMDS